MRLEAHNFPSPSERRPSEKGAALIFPFCSATFFFQSFQRGREEDGAKRKETKAYLLFNLKSGYKGYAYCVVLGELAFAK